MPILEPLVSPQCQFGSRRIKDANAPPYPGAHGVLDAISRRRWHVIRPNLHAFSNLVLGAKNTPEF